jgi:putative hemolysin
MIVEKEAWDLLKQNPFKLPNGYGLFYRMTKYSAWEPAIYSWCINRGYYYKNSKDTGKSSHEICLTPVGRPCPYFLWELDEFNFYEIGLSFIDESKYI